MAQHRTKKLICTLLLPACGTVVGNPRKPGGTPDSPAPANAAVYVLPSLSFALPAEATVPDAALLLVAPTYAATDFGYHDRGVLTGWGQRVNKLTNEIDNVTTRINDLVAKERKSGNISEPLIFANKGAKGNLGGKITTLPSGGDYAYEAVLCYAGQVFTDFKWSEGSTKIDLVRDFSVQADGVASTYGVKTHLTWEKSDALALTLRTQGGWQESQLVGAGAYLTEYSQVRRLASTELQLQVVEEHAAAKSDTFAADTYLVARMTPTAAGATTLNSEFAGYFASAPACKNGFAEAAADLWHPLALSEPHFCMGRPFGGTQFTTLAQYYDALADLQPLGFASQTKLETVDFAAGTACD